MRQVPRISVRTWNLCVTWADWLIFSVRVMAHDEGQYGEFLPSLKELKSWNSYWVSLEVQKTPKQNKELPTLKAKSLHIIS